MPSPALPFCFVGCHTIDVLESSTQAIWGSTVTTIVSAFFILSHYEFFPCCVKCASWLTYGGVFELIASVTRDQSKRGSLLRRVHAESRMTIDSYKSVFEASIQWAASLCDMSFSCLGTNPCIHHDATCLPCENAMS